jgi:hypothetical protein
VDRSATPPEEVAGFDHEVKFVFTGDTLAVARAILHSACRREEPHAASLVETIYFDGSGLASLEEKLSSDYRKVKIRLRWYDRSPAVWLEVKRRVGSRREKLRLPVGPMPVGTGSFDGRELSRTSLDTPHLDRVPALLAAAGEAPPASLQPVLHLSYRRERFVEPASGHRISLDSEITALRIADRAAGNSAVRHFPGHRRSPFLVEVKGASRDLPHGLAALAALGGRRESFSKYSFCLLD